MGRSFRFVLDGGSSDRPFGAYRKLHISAGLLFNYVWRTFLEVMRDGSLSGAGRRLGLAQPTVGRHVDALETALGLPLFARSPRGLAPTEAAANLAPPVEAMGAASAPLARAA